MTIALGLMTSLASAGPAAAESGKLVDFSLGLSSTVPSSPSGMSLEVVFHTAGSPDKKSSPVRSVVIAAPSGTIIKSGAMPQCQASDGELHALGANACPADTQAGMGSYSAILGLGAPIDPFVGDNHVFNGPNQLIEVITMQGTSASPGFDRLTVDKNTLTAHPPVTPGGPPDGETATRSIQFTIPVHTTQAGSLITTPAGCPPGGYWESSGTFGFADGQTETVTSRTPCGPGASGDQRPGSPPGAVPGKRRHCLKSARLTLRVPRAGRVANRRVTLFINRKAVRKVSPSARRVRVDLSQRPPGRYRVCVRALTANGQKLDRHRVVRTCG